MGRPGSAPFPKGVAQITRVCGRSFVLTNCFGLLFLVCSIWLGKVFAGTAATAFRRPNDACNVESHRCDCRFHPRHHTHNRVVDVDRSPGSDQRSACLGAYSKGSKRPLRLVRGSSGDKVATMARPTGSAMHLQRGGLTGVPHGGAVRQELKSHQRAIRITFRDGMARSETCRAHAATVDRVKCATWRHAQASCSPKDADHKPRRMRELRGRTRLKRSGAIRICRLRLAPASGISALVELWPSG